MSAEEGLINLLLPGVLMIILLIAEDFIFAVLLASLRWISDATRRFR